MVICHVEEFMMKDVWVDQTQEDSVELKVYKIIAQQKATGNPVLNIPTCNNINSPYVTLKQGTYKVNDTTRNMLPNEF